jgi:multisubunit Na+/H+ antiporter MnhF subunit
MQSEKVFYVGCHVIVFLTWLHVMRRIIDRWNLMKPDMHFDLCLFMVFFCLLWLNAFRDKNAYINVAYLAAVNGILLAGYRLAFLHM